MRMHREATMYFLGIAYFCGVVGILAVFFSSLQAASCIGSAWMYCSSSSAVIYIGLLFVVAAFGTLVLVDRYGATPPRAPNYPYARNNGDVAAAAILLIIIGVILFFAVGTSIIFR